MTHPRPAFNHRTIHARPPRRSAGQQPTADAGGAYAQLFQGMTYNPGAPPPDFAARAHNPTLAPWIALEPSGYVDGLNAYLAFGDNPVTPLDLPDPF